MLDGIHTGEHRIVDPLQRSGMRGHLVSLAMSFVDNGPELLEREGRDAVVDATGHDVIDVVHKYFDPVGATRNLLADGATCIVRAVHMVSEVVQLFPPNDDV